VASGLDFSERDAIGAAVASGYLCYLAWRIATAEPGGAKAQGSGRPLTFLEAALFQYANPKAWIMAISAVSAFTASGETYVASAVGVALTCSLVNLPSISLWAGFGLAIGRILETPRAWRRFNRTMGALTAACVLLIVLD
jgi:threonine/homoserine/homoserine lactone efflux protein